MTTDTAQAFGWATTLQKRKKQVENTEQTPKTVVPAHQCAVLIALPPFYPRSLLDQLLLVWMEDFGFSHVGFSVSPVSAGRTHVERSPFQTSCIVDVGWSATHVVPLLNSKLQTPPEAIRRLPLGGRHLIRCLAYHTSYRQWNLMDQEWLIRQVLQKLAYVSLSFREEMETARFKSAGRRPFDREFLLPDFQTIMEGQVRLPPALQRDLEKSAAGAGDDDEEDDDSDDEDVKEEDMQEEDVEDDGADPDGGDEDDEEGSNDEEETLEQAKKRLLQQREEEERRKREIEAEQQVLNISVERFAIPEILFRPTDAGLPADWASLPVTIVQSIQACPEMYHAALYKSITLVGGMSQLENLRARLEVELRALVPCEYELEIQLSENPLEDAWRGTQHAAKTSSYTQWSISRQEWEAAGKRSAYSRLLTSTVGCVV